MARQQVSLIVHLAEAFTEADCESEETLTRSLRESGIDPDRSVARIIARLQEFIVPDEPPRPA